MSAQAGGVGEWRKRKLLCEGSTDGVSEGSRATADSGTVWLIDVARKRWPVLQSSGGGERHVRTAVNSDGGRRRG